MMKKYAQMYTWFLLFVFCISTKGQTKTDLPTDTIKSETKGVIISQVPNSMVRNIKQDRNGNILIASYRGVFRYDGTLFTNITSTIRLPSFWDVLEDRKGNLWFATRDSGVYNYNGKSFQHFTTQQGLASNQVLHIYEDRAGIIWFGTGGGLSRYDGNSFRNFTTKEGHWNNDITTIIEDKTGKLWIGTRGDAFVFDGKTFTTLTHKGKAFNNVWSIIEDKKGNIWLGADGLFRYDGRTFTKVTQRGAYDIIEDRKGNIWTTGEVSNGNWTLSRYDQKYLYNEKPAVTEIMSRGPALLGLLEAEDGSIWFGASDGVYRYDGNTITDFKGKQVQE
jgi:ligand-binding sensor domain-containing protein